MKKFIDSLRLNLALFIIWLTRPLYFWSMSNIIVIREEKNHKFEPQIPETDIEYCKDVVMSYFNNIWKECFSSRIARIHKGRVRYDAWIITPKRDWNTHKPIPDTADAYVIRFNRERSDTQEIDVSVPRI